MKSAGKNRLRRTQSRFTATSVLRRVGVWCLVLGLLNAVGRNLGPMSDATLRLMMGVGCVALLGTGSWRARSKLDWRAAGTGVGLWLLGWLVVLLGATSAIRMAGVAPMVLGVHHLLRATGSRLPDLRGVLAMSLVAVAWEVARETVPRLGEVLVGISAGWSRFWVWGLLRQGVKEGPAAIGGGIVATGLLAVWMMVLTRGGRRTRWVMLGWGSIGVLGMNVLFLGLQNGWGGVASTARAQFLSGVAGSGALGVAGATGSEGGAEDLSAGAGAVLGTGEGDRAPAGPPVELGPGNGAVVGATTFRGRRGGIPGCGLCGLETSRTRTLRGVRDGLVWVGP